MKRRKSTKGQNITSDFIPYEVAMARGLTLLMDPKKAKIGIYIIFAANTGLRVSDILSRTHEELHGKRFGDVSGTAIPSEQKLAIPDAPLAKNLLARATVTSADG